jgi:hypothetical protein
VLAVHLQGAYNVTRPAFQAMREKWKEITTLEDAKEYSNANAALMAMLTTPAPQQASAEEREGGLTTFQGVFERMGEFFQEDFLKYISGQLPAMQAYSSGRLKIEGDKSQLIEKLFKF